MFWFIWGSKSSNEGGNKEQGIRVFAIMGWNWDNSSFSVVILSL